MYIINMGMSLQLLNYCRAVFFSLLFLPTLVYAAETKLGAEADTNFKIKEVVLPDVLEPIELRIKVTPNVASQLEKTIDMPTRLSHAKSLKIVRKTGVAAFDQQLHRYAVKSVKRTFPYAGQHEAQQIQAGLHLWYSISLDEIQTAAKSIAYSQSIDQLTVNERELILHAALTALKADLQQQDGVIMVELSRDVVPDRRNKSGVDKQQPPVSSKPLNNASVTKSIIPPNDPGFENALELQSNPNHRIYDIYNTPVEDRQRDVDLDVIETWNAYGRGGDPDVIVAMMDTVCSYDHPDLIDSAWINSAEDLDGDGRLTAADINNADDDNNGYVDDVIAWDFRENDNDPRNTERGSHGDAVWGIIAASNHNNEARSSIAGAWLDRPGVRVMCMKEYNLPAALAYAANNGAVIFNLSFTGSNSQANQEAIDYFRRYARSENRRRQGLVFIAAGNTGPEDTNQVTYYSPVIAVAMQDHVGELSTGSGIGDLAAQCTTATLGAGGFGCGTSYASPAAAGTAAYLWSLDPSLRGEEVYDAIRLTATSPQHPYAGDGFVNTYDAARYLMEGELPVGNGSSIAPDHPSFKGYTTVNRSDDHVFSFNFKNYHQQFQRCTYAITGEHASHFSLNVSHCNLSAKATVPVELTFHQPPVSELNFGDVFTANIEVYRSNGTTHTTPVEVAVLETEFNIQRDVLQPPEGASLNDVLAYDAADIDWDGQLDVVASVLVEGEIHLAVYQLNGEQFVLKKLWPTGIAGYQHYQVYLDIIDYDDDNRVEVFLNLGASPSSMQKYLIEFSARQVFNSNIQVKNTGSWLTDVDAKYAWIDVNNDGKLDLAGADFGNSLYRIYTKQFGRVFTSYGSYRASSSAHPTWQDVDFDGSLDYLASSYPEEYNFSKATSIGLNDRGLGMEPLRYSANYGRHYGFSRFMMVFDLDLDGNLDIMGDQMIDHITLDEYYITERKIDQKLLFLSNCSKIYDVGYILDIDSNGQLDRMCSRYQFNDMSLIMYGHNQDYALPKHHKYIENDILLAFLNDGDRYSAWTQRQSRRSIIADFNQDNRQDVLGRDEARRFVLQLNTGPSNQVPTAPTQLSHVIAGERVTLHWQPTIDDTTASQNLRYNVAVFRAPRGEVVVSPMAYMFKGTSLVDHFDNAGFNTSKWLRALPAGEYFWQVQAIDASNARSQFSKKASFTIERDMVDLSLTMQTQDSRAENGETQATITITNDDSLAAHGVVVAYKPASDTYYINNSRSAEFDDNHLRWHVGTLVAGASKTITVTTGGYERGNRFVHSAEIFAAYESDPDSVTANRRYGEDDYAVERLNTLPLYADLELTTSVLSDTSDQPDGKVVMALTLTNKAHASGDFLRRATVKLDHPNGSQNGLRICGVSRDYGYNAMHRLWLVKDLAVGEAHSLQITLCGSGGAIDPGDRYDGYAEIISASNRPLQLNTTYGNHSTDEQDDAQLSYEVPLRETEPPQVQVRTYIRNYCPRMRIAMPFCYNISYYQIKNMSTTAIDHLDMQFKRSAGAFPVYAYTWGQQFERSSRSWTITDLAPKGSAYIYMIHFDRMPEQQISQVLNSSEPVYVMYPQHGPTRQQAISNTSIEVELESLSSQLASHRWQSNRSMYVFDW